MPQRSPLATHLPVQRPPVLEALRAGLPKTHRRAGELRHRGWLRDEFSALLERHGPALVLQDLHSMPKLNLATPTSCTLPDDFSRARIDRSTERENWAKKTRAFAARAPEVFVFANHRYHGHTPAPWRDLAERLGRPLPASFAEYPSSTNDPGRDAPDPQRGPGVGPIWCGTHPPDTVEHLCGGLYGPGRTSVRESTILTSAPIGRPGIEAAWRGRGRGGGNAWSHLRLDALGSP